MAGVLEYLGYGGAATGAAGTAAGAAGTAAPAFTAAAGATPAAGTTAFGASGLGGAAGAAGAGGVGAAPGFLSQLGTAGTQALQGIGNYGMGVLNPGQGNAATNIGAAQAAGQSPAFGDIIQLISQQLLNQELGKAAGPAFRPIADALRPLPSYKKQPSSGARLGPAA